MSYYSIATAARELEIQRHTLYEWITKNYIPPPKAGMMAGSSRELWTEEEMGQIRDWKKHHYRGKGLKKDLKKKGKGNRSKKK